MKPAHERNQECLPPKKRDLLVSSNSGSSGSSMGDGGGGEEAGSAHGPDSASRDSQVGSSAPGEWMQVQPGMPYSMENSDGAGGPVDQYGMVYKVALPSATYSPTSLHPVLSHISPAYTVPSSLLQHPGIPYPPLGYAQIPHSSLQFVSSPYAIPYAVPPGFVPSPLIPPQSAIPQPHHVPHLVPYPSVIQGGMVSPPSQPMTSGHALAKTAAAGSVPMVLSPEQATAQQQHLGSAAEGNPRGVPVFYHHTGTRPALPAGCRDSHGAPTERDKEVNGGEEQERGGEELPQDSAYSSRGMRLLHAAPPGSADATDHPQDRASRRSEARGSPGHRNTPDTDLEVQQVVGRLASPNQAVSGGRKEAALGPLNLSQGSQQEREALVGVRGEDIFATGQMAYAIPPVGSNDPRVLSQQQQAHHAVLLANGQQLLVPLNYQHHQQHYPGPPNDVTIAASTAPSPKASEPPARPCPPERAMTEAVVEHTPALGAVLPVAPPPSSSHFTKGAIIQLATGELKRVEDLQTQDFVRSAEMSGGLKIDSSMVVDIRKSQKPGLVALHFTVGEQQSKVAIDVPPEHPFFVFGQGWSSCSPDRTAQLYGLTCHHLQAGDVCVSITLQQQQQKQHQQQQQQQQQAPSRTSNKASSGTNISFRPMGPPAPQHPRPPAHLRGERTQRVREEEQPMQVGGTAAHGDTPLMSDRTSAEHTRSRSSYHLHTDGPPRPGAGAGVGVTSLTGMAQRRWSTPGFQKYEIKSEEGVHPSVIPTSSSSGSLRPSFIPQEVKLSIEGRSNAGK